MPVYATGYFWNRAFERQWQVDEAAVPGFWGPLNTSTARREPYENRIQGAFCPQGTRIGCDAAAYRGRTVQYFDKGRMEASIRLPLSHLNQEELTDGRLVVEMETGQIQVDDTAFDPRLPATTPLVGDPGNDGPTYADLATLPVRDTDTGTTLLPYTFDVSTRQWERLQALPVAIPLPIFTCIRDADATGPYGQNVLTAFMDYQNRVPSGFAAIGWPITPVFVVEASVNGTPTTLVLQAFERRVLVYDATRPTGQEVDSTFVGRDYYDWRYGPNDRMRYGPILPPAASPMMPPRTPSP